MEQDQAGSQENVSSAANSENQETLTKEQRDYKKDMFRYKTQAKELEERIRDFEMREEEAKGNVANVISTLKEENRKPQESKLRRS